MLSEKTISNIKNLINSFNISLVSLHFNCQTFPNSSFGIDFETRKLLGNITIWNNGYMDVLVYNVPNQKEVFNKNFICLSESDLMANIKGVFEDVVEGYI